MESILRGQFHIPTFGRHNIANVTAVIGLLLHCRIWRLVLASIWRPCWSETSLLLESSHRNSDPRWLLRTIQRKLLQPWMQPVKITWQEIVAIFQPHTFTRTIALLDELKFKRSLESSRCRLLGTDLWFTGSRSRRCESWRFGSKIEQTVQRLLQLRMFLLQLGENAVYVFMGAGDIQTHYYLSVYHLVWTHSVHSDDWVWNRMRPQIYICPLKEYEVRKVMIRFNHPSWSRTAGSQRRTFMTMKKEAQGHHSWGSARFMSHFFACRAGGDAVVLTTWVGDRRPAF